MTTFHDWGHTLRPGDLMARPSRPPRVVRRVKWLPERGMGWVQFVILRCSWTHRAITTYSFSELHSLGYTPTGQRVSLRRDIDWRIAHDAGDDHTCPSIQQCLLDCCDVRGLR